MHEALGRWHIGCKRGSYVCRQQVDSISRLLSLSSADQNFLSFFKDCFLFHPIEIVSTRL